MSITPDETSDIKVTTCSGCGTPLHVNNRSIFFDAMAEHPLLLGDCCADKVLGALIQDYSEVLTKHCSTWPSYWITQHYEERMAAVAKAAKIISDVYTDAISGLRYFSKGEDK